jgi:hydrogenase maturation protease
MSALVIGIGNSLAGDDGMGIRAIAQLRKTVSDQRVCFVESERAGLDLLDLLEGHPTALIIDAAWTGKKPPGTISSFSIRRPFAVETLPSLHTIGLCTVLVFGTTMGINLPEEVTVYTVEARDIETFHEGCTPEVEAAIQDLTDMIVTELQRILPDFAPTAVDSHEVKQPILDTTSMEFV